MLEMNDNQSPVQSTLTTAPLEDTTHFTNALKEWVEVDNKITYYNQQLKTYRQQRNHLTPSICHFMERENMQDTKIEISDGSLQYASEQVTPSFTQKFILEGLIAFYKHKAVDDADALAKECVEFLKSRRVSETKTVLKRKYSNK